MIIIYEWSYLFLQYGKISSPLFSCSYTYCSRCRTYEDNYLSLFFFCRCLPHVEMSMKNKHESRMSHPSAPLKHFYVVPWNSAYFNSCHEATLRFLFLDNQTQNIYCGHRAGFTYSLLRLLLSRIRSWFSSGHCLSPGPAVQWNDLQCPTYSEIRSSLPLGSGRFIAPWRERSSFSLGSHAEGTTHACSSWF